MDWLLILYGFIWVCFAGLYVSMIVIVTTNYKDDGNIYSYKAIDEFYDYMKSLTDKKEVQKLKVIYYSFWLFLALSFSAVFFLR